MRLTEKTWQAPDGVIHYWTVRAGAEKRWLVFLPGLTADHRLFAPQVEALGERFNCLVWDAPAHGASRPFALRFSLDGLAEYLRGILAAEGIRLPVLVGQSMGGYIAQAYMARWPDSAAGFAAIDSAPLSRRYYTKAELWLLKHMEGVYLAFPWGLMAEWGARGTAETEQGRALMREMTASYGRREFCALAAHGYRILAQAVEARQACAVSCPILLLCGEKDAAGSCKRYAQRWSAKEGHPLVWVPAAGHNANTDAPEFVNGKLEEFVRGLG